MQFNLNERVHSSQTLVWFSLLWDFRPLCSVKFFKLTVGVSTTRWCCNQYHLAVETPTVSLRKFTEQSGRKSHNMENQTSVCDEWTLSFVFLPNRWISLGNLTLFRAMQWGSLSRQVVMYMYMFFSCFIPNQLCYWFTCNCTTFVVWYSCPSLIKTAFLPRNSVLIRNKINNLILFIVFF